MMILRVHVNVRVMRIVLYWVMLASYGGWISTTHTYKFNMSTPIPVHVLHVPLSTVASSFSASWNCRHLSKWAQIWSCDVKLVNEWSVVPAHIVHVFPNRCFQCSSVSHSSPHLCFSQPSSLSSFDDRMYIVDGDWKNEDICEWFLSHCIEWFESVNAIDRKRGRICCPSVWRYRVNCDPEAEWASM